MIDFHNHILPDIDDGSRSINMTLNMLREAEKQGITEVINTVHFQHPKMAKKHITFESISKVVNNLQYRVKKEK